MSSPSSATMCTSTDDCFCHEQVRQSRSRYSACTQRRMSSALIASKSSSGSGGALAKQHLLQRVAPEPETERLEWDDLLRRDVPEVHARAELLDERGLRALRRRLEEEVPGLDVVNDLVDQARPHLARRPVDARRAALAPFGDHLPG